MYLPFIRSQSTPQPRKADPQQPRAQNTSGKGLTLPDKPTGPSSQCSRKAKFHCYSTARIRENFPAKPSSFSELLEINSCQIPLNKIPSNTSLFLSLVILMLFTSTSTPVIVIFLLTTIHKVFFILLLHTF